MHLAPTSDAPADKTIGIVVLVAYARGPIDKQRRIDPIREPS